MGSNDMTGGCSSGERIRHGLESIPVDRVTDVPLRDLMQVHQTLAELVGFLHQTDNYKTIGDLQRFLGSADKGAYKELSDCLYTLMDGMLPQDIKDRFDDFDPGGSPNYDNS